MDQRFEDDVMQDLSGEGPAASGGEAAFAAMAAAATDGFGEESLEDDLRDDADPAADLSAEDGYGEDAGVDDAAAAGRAAHPAAGGRTERIHHGR